MMWRELIFALAVMSSIYHGFLTFGLLVRKQHIGSLNILLMAFSFTIVIMLALNVW